MRRRAVADVVRAHAEAADRQSRRGFGQGNRALLQSNAEDRLAWRRGGDELSEDGGDPGLVHAADAGGVVEVAVLTLLAKFTVSAALKAEPTPRGGRDEIFDMDSKSLAGRGAHVELEDQQHGRGKVGVLGQPNRVERDRVAGARRVQDPEASQRLPGQGEAVLPVAVEVGLEAKVAARDFRAALALHVQVVHVQRHRAIGRVWLSSGSCRRLHHRLKWTMASEYPAGEVPLPSAQVAHPRRRGGGRRRRSGSRRGRR